MRPFLYSFIPKSLSFNKSSFNIFRNYSRQTSSFLETINQTHFTSFVAKRSLGSKINANEEDESRNFMAVFPDIIRDLTEESKFSDIPDVMEWFAKVLRYNLPGGKQHRALILITAYRILCPPHELTEENLQLSRILGWCIELLQAYILIMDDIMDASETRRGRLCWHLCNGNEKMALNDSMLVYSGVFEILKKYFENKPYYTQIIELFHEITMKTIIGQSLDMLLSTNFKKTKKMDEFTMDRYKSVMKYKTGYQSFQLSIASAMYMCGILDQERHRKAEYLALEIGNYYQIQNDYLDCFGDAEFTGKLGTDIQDGKCTWLLIVTLQKVTFQEKALLEDCYGVQDPTKIEKVKQIYKDIGIPQIYSIYEEQTYKLLFDQIQQLCGDLPDYQIFFKILNKIYGKS